MHPPVFILGVRIDAVTLSEARDRLVGFLASEQQHHVMTPNPEMLVAAHRDPAFRILLGETSLNVPDGAGLLWAARRVGGYLPERVTGIDFLSSLLERPDLPPVFLLGAAPGIAEKAAQVLQMKNSTLRIAGTFSGSPRPEEEDSIVARITASGAGMLFVAYGAPAQDFWIQRNMRKMPSVRVAMGVGGAFDFLAGAQKRAPHALQIFGLEWLWRLLQEPRRISRIITAVVVFPRLILTEPSHR